MIRVCSTHNNFIQAHGGTIWAESEGEGQGSAFHIKLKKI